MSIWQNVGFLSTSLKASEDRLKTQALHSSPDLLSEPFLARQTVFTSKLFMGVSGPQALHFSQLKQTNPKNNDIKVNNLLS